MKLEIKVNGVNIEKLASLEKFVINNERFIDTNLNESKTTLVSTGFIISGIILNIKEQDEHGNKVSRKKINELFDIIGIFPEKAD